MNSKFIASTIVAIAALSGASAFAQTNQYGEAALVIAPVASTSSVTRAQVNADYLQARQNGNLAVSQEAAFALAPVSATALSRAEVRSQAVMSARAAQLTGNSAI